MQLHTEHKGQFSIGAAIGLVIVLMVGVVMGLPVINQSIDDVTTETTVTNEDINATNGTTQTLANAQGNDLKDNSETVFEGGTTLTRGTNYTVDNAAMTLTFIDVTDNATVFNDSAAQANYTYHSESYVENGTTRTVMNQIPIFVAVGLLAIVAFAIQMRR